MTHPATVTLHLVPNLMDPGQVTTSAEEWVAGMTLADLLPDGWAANQVVWDVNGEPVGKGEGALAAAVPAEAVVRACAVPGSESSSFFQDASAQLGASIKNTLGRRVAGYQPQTMAALRRFRDWLFQVPKSGRPVNSQGNTVYGWGGVASQYDSAGVPLPWLYGDMRVGAYVVSQDVEIREGPDGPDSILRVLCAISDRAGGGIGQYTTDQDDLEGENLPDGVLLNGNSLENFDGVKCWLRMGNLSQAPIPGFDVIRTGYAVGLEIEQGNGTPADPLVTDWITYAETWDMPQGAEADGLKLTFTFNGLGQIHDNGAFIKAKVKLQVRITKLDSGGTPFGASAIFPSSSDSFVFSEKISTAFDHQVAVPLFDPDTYTEPPLGKALGFDKAPLEYAHLDPATMASLALPGFVTGEQPDEFTLELHVRPRAHNARNPLWCWGDWNENEVVPMVEGLVLFLRQFSSPEGNKSELVLWAGDTTTGHVAAVIDGAGELDGDDLNEWHSVVVVYQKASASGVPRTTLYLNGAKVGEVSHASDNPVQWVTGAGGVSIVINGLPQKLTDGTGQWHGQVDHDEWTLYDHAKTSTQVAGLHNGGGWVTHSDLAGLGASVPGVVVGSKMEGLATIPGPLEVVGVYGPQDGPPFLANYMLTSSALTELSDGAVLDQSQNTLLRHRYRVEVQRTNTDKAVIKVSDSLSWSLATLELQEVIGYVGTQLMALEILATGQLSSSRPNVTIQARGRQVDVWDGVDEAQPSFTKQASRNPAWQVLDLLAAQGGLGRFFDVSNVRLDTILALAENADQQVYDQLGKRRLELLDTADNGDGTATVTVRTTLPLPAHWVVGISMKLRNVAPACWPVQSGVSTLEDIQEVDPTTVDLLLSWPGANPEPANLLGDEASQLDSGAWAWGVPFGVIDEVDSETPANFPDGPYAPAAEVITFPDARALRTFNTVPTVTEGNTYRLACRARVTDGLGPYTLALELGQARLLLVVPDDGLFHVVSGFVQAVGAADFRVGSWLAGQGIRQLALTQCYVGETEDDQLHDEGLLAGQVAPANLLTSPERLSDTDVWVPLNGAALLTAGVKGGPAFAPGQVEAWALPSNSAKITHDGSLAGLTISAQDYYVALALRSRDRKFGTTSVQFTVGGTVGATLEVPMDGEWHVAGDVISSAGSNDDVVLRFLGAQGGRELDLTAAYLAASSVPVPYDNGADLGELFGAEALHECDIHLGDRGAGAWDTLLDMLATCRASPYMTGDQVALRVDRPRAPVALITPAQIVGDSFQRTLSDPSEQPNRYQAEIQSRLLNGERDIVQRDHPSLEAGDETSSNTLRSEVLDLRGVTRPSQAVRELDYRLVGIHLRNETIGLEVTPDGAELEPGDVFSLVHPLGAWGVAGKQYDDATDAKVLTVDAAMVLFRRNTLAWSNALEQNAVWRTLGNAGPAPVVTGNAAAEPAIFGGEQVAALVTFSDVPTGSWLIQDVGNRGDGVVWAAIVWLRLASGPDEVYLRLESAGGFFGGGALSLTSSWARYVVTGTCPDDLPASAWVRWRLQRTNALAGDTVVEVARARLIPTADDGRDAVAVEASEELAPVYVGVRDEEDGSLEWAEAVSRAGAWEVGDELHLVTSLSKLPRAGSLLAFGPGSKLEQWEVLSSSLTMQLHRRIQAVRYDPDAYPDPDDYEGQEDPEVTAQQLAVAAAASDNLLPAPVVDMQLTEEPVRDSATGDMRNNLVVSWSLDREDGGYVAEVRVYARGVDEDNGRNSSDTRATPWDLLGTVAAPRRELRVPHHQARLQASERMQVVVVTVNRAGLHLPVRRGTMRELTAFGFYSLPPIVRSSTIRLVGDGALYRVGQPPVPEDSLLQIVRGGVFIHQEVDRRAAGGITIGPTPNWCDLPDSLVGHGPIPNLARLVSAGGHAGEWVELGEELDLTAWSAPLADEAFEDNWGESGELGDHLQQVWLDDGTGGWALEFKPTSSAILAYWRQNAQMDLGRVRNVHLSVAANGSAVHYVADDDVPAADTVRGERWTEQGPLDPADPQYGAVSVTLEASMSVGADAGLDWHEVVPGVYQLRTVRFRLRVDRPHVGFNVLVHAYRYRLRPTLPADSILNDREIVSGIGSVVAENGDNVTAEDGDTLVTE